VVYFAGASCRSGTDAPRTSATSTKRRQHNAADFTTSDKHSLSGAEFPPARNVASARDLKPVPIMSSKTDNPPQILPSNPVLSPTPIAPCVRDKFVRGIGTNIRHRHSRARRNPMQRHSASDFEPRMGTDSHGYSGCVTMPSVFSSVKSVALSNRQLEGPRRERSRRQIPSTDFFPTHRRQAESWPRCRAAWVVTRWVARSPTVGNCSGKNGV